MKNLYIKALLSVVATALAMGLLLFLAAGTLRYWQAWIYLAVFTAASLVVTLYLMRDDPALLERRMKGGPTAEKETSQKIIRFLPRSGSSGCCWCRRLTIVSVGRRYRRWW